MPQKDDGNKEESYVRVVRAKFAAYLFMPRLIRISQGYLVVPSLPACLSPSAYHISQIYFMRNLVMRFTERCEKLRVVILRQCESCGVVENFCWFVTIWG
jgi:hypothetical protein